MAQHTKGNEGIANNSFALVLKTIVQNTKMAYDPSPALDLDDSCILEKDMSCLLMGKIKDINALSNLYVILANEGFEQVNLTYIGGVWVLIDTSSTSSKEKISKHVRVASWFKELLPASDSFVSENRLVWISVEGLPMRTWTRNTFAKIVSPCGSLLEVEDEEDSSLPYKKLCVILKPHTVIDYKIKVIVKGHVYWIRVKELEAWSPDFSNYLSDNSSAGDLLEDEDVKKVNGKKGNTCEEDKETEVDHVSESSCVNINGDAFENNSIGHDKKNTPKDPFGIYKILNRKNGKKDFKSDDPCFPPGFTPVDVKETFGETNGDSINQPNEDLQTNQEGLGQSAKKSWIQEINRKHKVNFVAIQETKMKDIGLFSIKALWGNFSYDFAFNPFVGSSGGILCVWDPNLFIKDSVTISDSFMAVRGTSVPTSTKLLIVSVYAPQDLSEKRVLWEYIGRMTNLWEGECVILGDFNEARSKQERFGTTFNALGATSFNHFISSAGLVDLPFEGYSFTCSHKSALKMRKLDRFIISEGLLLVFPSLSAICLNKHLSDHRPILMREVVVDYGITQFRIFHLWFSKPGFDKLVEDSWSNSTFEEINNISLLKKKFQASKASIKSWCEEEKQQSTEARSFILCRLVKLDKLFDQGKGNDDLVNERTTILKELQVINARSSLDMAQKAEIRWSIEGDENSKYFHGIVNKKRFQLAIRGILVEGDWIDEPAKKEDLERSVTYDEIKRSVWDCGTNKSPGPDGFSFDFIRRYWKTQDAKMVKDFRPISLVGSTYKIITKIMANRLSMVISDLVSDVQSAFVSNRQILDGPFILNELLSWYKFKKTKAMIFKVDFEKAFDSVRWDFLDDILYKFGFGTKWRGWIQGCLNSAMGSIIVNGSPTSEFKFHKGLKQGDPLSPFLFILVMESLHLSFNHILNAGLFKGILINNSLTLSHLLYADDAVFIGKWDKSNLVTIVNVLKCFFLAYGLKINIHKSKLMGIGIPQEEVNSAASLIGCTTLSALFNYLGVKVGAPSFRNSSWEEVLSKISYLLSKWKLKALFIGGRLTLLTSVLSSMSLYHMSIYKVPMGVLNRMESLRRNSFNGVDNKERKISMIGWKKVLASKKKGGLGVSSFFALNRALLFKWILRFISHDSSLWSRFIKLCMEFATLLIIQKKMGNGEHTFFWEDVWLTDRPLKLSFPRLYALKCEKNTLDSASDFSVKSTRTLIDDFFLPSVGNETRWVNVIPIKINVFAWKVCLDKLPTRFYLSLRGLDIPSVLCHICHSAGESSSHLFFSCNVPRLLQSKIARWWDLVVLDIHSYDDWLSWFSSLRLVKGLKMFGRRLLRLWWVIWKFRNLVLFGNSQPCLELLFDEIVSLSFTWCSSRCKRESSSHLFFSCNVARLLQSKIARWWDLVVLDIHSYDNWLSWFSSLRLVKGLKDVWKASSTLCGG
nr:RNA-directed DNA polymerase, eukaryota, reverse transcriptase zinc-binding domain protein [Tanacetum cinerariifolium]